MTVVTAMMVIMVIVIMMKPFETHDDEMMTLMMLLMITIRRKRMVLETVCHAANQKVLKEHLQASAIVHGCTPPWADEKTPCHRSQPLIQLVYPRKVVMLGVGLPA